MIINVSEGLSLFVDGKVEGELTDNNDAISSSLFVLFIQLAKS